MTQVSTNYKREPQYSSAMMCSALGGATWGAMEYLVKKKPYLDKDGELKDTFIKKMEDALVKIKDTDTTKIIEEQKNIEKEIDTLTTSDELKNFLQKREKDFSKFTEEEINLLKNEIGSQQPNSAKEFLKKLFKSNGKYYNHFNETLEACCDEAGKLKHDANKISKEKWNTIKSVTTDFRVKSAMKAGITFAAISALGGCVYEFFTTRKN